MTKRLLILDVKFRSGVNLDLRPTMDIFGGKTKFRFKWKLIKLIEITLHIKFKIFILTLLRKIFVFY